ncbi:MAG: endo alpha-1,4 polygalactosaminidase [Flavisolibacter sp.]
MKYIYLLLLIAGFYGCQKFLSDEKNVPAQVEWWKPNNIQSFDWYLGKATIQDQFSTSIVDLDAFETSPDIVISLHSKSKKIIAYLSVGTIENNRPDSSLVPKELIGNIYTQWPNEKWLDIRQIEKLRPWITSRLDMIKAKGFDGVEPDNLDAYEQSNTGFSISEQDTRKFLDFLILEAHNRGLSIGQKNLPTFSKDYSSKFDWALIEDAFVQGWQDSLSVYIAGNKPVFAVEYTDVVNAVDFQNKICPSGKKLHFATILKNRDLSKTTYFCN